MPRLPLILCLLFALCVLSLGQTSDEGAQRLPSDFYRLEPVHRVVIEATDVVSRTLLNDRGAILEEIDYGSFSVVFVDEVAFGGRAALKESGLELADVQDNMVFNRYVIDGRAPEPVLATLLGEESYGAPGAPDMAVDAHLYVVQFHAPTRDPWLARIEAVGIRVISYVPHNAYIVAADAEQAMKLRLLEIERPEIQFTEPYHPAFKMRPTIRSAARSGLERGVPVTIQLDGGAGSDRAATRVEALLEDVFLTYRVGHYLNIAGIVDSAVLHQIAREPFVIAIEGRGVRRPSDERQGQIMAGNSTGAAPTSPGYLSWIQSQGFNSSQFGSFAVNVVDDATSLTGHPDLAGSRVDFALNPTGQGGTQAGHGFLNAHIVGGLNTDSSGPTLDSLGYRYGLGIAPWAHVGSTAIFGGTSASSSSWENTAYSLGARISTNSWNFQSGIFGDPIPTYDINSQEYDFIVRDARSSVSGNQEYMVLFSAANAGPSANTVSTPTTAKNVLSVGAGENYRPTGTDGCGISNSGANDLNDIISFSSRGPTDDGRWKPELVAPGTHIQAGVPQSNYNGSGVCNQYWPSGQTLYGWSSGTSHSTPAVAGAAALVRQKFLNDGMPAPSPAMNKAVLVNAAEYMTGVSANDTLPSNNQGMGYPNLSRAFDSASKILVDQSVVFGTTGQTHVVTGAVGSTSQDFRVTLVWTDAPGTSSSAPWVNNLNLTVDIGGSTYRGNVFSGALSATGGSADAINNTESVHLAAGVSGTFTVTVTAANIAGDGVPGNGDGTDQDFALVIWNGTANLTPPTAAFSGSPTSGTAPLTVNFSDQSSGTITNWAWDFGDGNTSTAASPQHTYTAAGSYDVMLTVSGPAGNEVDFKAGYVTVSPAPPPAAPSGLSAMPLSSSEIDLTWSDNSNNEDGFDLEWSADGTNFSALASVGANVTSFSDTGLSPSTQYFYRVRAFNGSGNSAFSNVDSATTTAVGTTDFRANADVSTQGSRSGSYLDTIGNDGVSESVTERLSGGKPVNRHSFMNHTWTFSVSASQTLTFHLNAWRTASSDGDDFAISYSTDNVSFTPLVTVTATSDDNVYSIVPMPPSLAGTVYVRVVDTNQTQGNQALDTFFVDDMFIRASGASMNPPVAPSGLTATAAGASAIDLGWNDNSFDEDGFDIERSADGTNFAPLASVPANSTVYSDTGLAASTTYYYRVRAFNGNGISSDSNVANATTGAVGAVDYRATGDDSTQGTRSGSYLDTIGNDGVSESITERLSGGKPSNRHSFLNHTWTFSVSPASSLTLHLNAWQSSSGDGDNFRFLYSTNNSNFTTLTTVTSTVDDVAYTTAALPANLSGIVYIRVEDTNQTQGNQGLDTIFVDDMFIRAQ